MVTSGSVVGSPTEVQNQTDHLQSRGHSVVEQSWCCQQRRHQSQLCCKNIGHRLYLARGPLLGRPLPCCRALGNVDIRHCLPCMSPSEHAASPGYCFGFSLACPFAVYHRHTKQYLHLPERRSLKQLLQFAEFTVAPIAPNVPLAVNRTVDFIAAVKVLCNSHRLCPSKKNAANQLAQKEQRRLAETCLLHSAKLKRCTLAQHSACTFRSVNEH